MMMIPHIKGLSGESQARTGATVLAWLAISLVWSALVAPTCVCESRAGEATHYAHQRFAGDVVLNSL